MWETSEQAVSCSGGTVQYNIYIIPRVRVGCLMQIKRESGKVAQSHCADL